jgi:phosphopantetheinyl transferase (holo-ACP synthase)
LIDEDDLGRRLGDALGIPLRLAAAALPLDPSALREEERRLLQEFASPVRRAAWLRGRAALRRLGVETPPPLPSPVLSLSHAGDWAVAVAAPAGVLAGLGVDLEQVRAPHEASVRKFMDGREQSWIAALDDGSRRSGLQRAWTVKEAAFKADPRNAGRVVGDYVLEDPPAEVGLVRRRDGSSGPWKAASLRVGGGWLSVAVLPVAPGARPQ